MKKWQCPVCEYIHTEDVPPEKCPVCGAAESTFVVPEDDSAPDTPKAEQAADENEPDAPKKESSIPNDTDTPNAPHIEQEGRAAVYRQKAAIYWQKTAVYREKAAVYWKKAVDLMLKHHAHPISVHLPNGVIPVAATLFIISWLSGSDLLVKAGFINLVFVLIALPLVGLTGVLEWKKKYNQARTTIFKKKIAAATVTAICCVASIIWYLVNPEVMNSSSAWLFVMINLLMLAAAGMAGYIGGKLVFKK